MFQQPCNKSVNLGSFLFTHCGISSRSASADVHLIRLYTFLLCSQYHFNNFVKIEHFLYIHYFTSGKPRVFKSKGTTPIHLSSNHSSTSCPSMRSMLSAGSRPSSKAAMARSRTFFASS
nr:MAG TPA: hypothetical protein [Caudoviricetes sp.]